jgi:putative cell wall-binding protein
MARKRTIDRVGQRAEFDEGQAKDEDEEKEEEAEDEEEEGDEEEAAGDDDEDAPPKPKKKKAPAKKKPAAPKRSRAPKVVRLKAQWVIFDNGSKQVESFDYNQKHEAEQFLAQKNTEKKGGFYLQMVKVPFEEKEK